MGPALILAAGLGLGEEACACILGFLESSWLVRVRLRQACPQLTTAILPGAALVSSSFQIRLISLTAHALSLRGPCGPHIGGVTEPMFSQQKQLLKMSFFQLPGVCFLCFDWEFVGVGWPEGYCLWCSRPPTIILSGS